MSKYEIGEKFYCLDELYEWAKAGKSIWATQYSQPIVLNSCWVLNQQFRYLAMHFDSFRKTKERTK